MKLIDTHCHIYYDSYKNDLDKPHGAVNEIHGDLMLEGRHGNSIRIGSRNVNPYIIMSNTNYKSIEGLAVGSTVALLDRGSIKQHFRDVKDFAKTGIGKLFGQMPSAAKYIGMLIEH